MKAGPSRRWCEVQLLARQVEDKMATKKEAENMAPKKPKGRPKGKGKGGADPGPGIDFDMLVMGAAPVTTTNDRITVAPTQEVA